MISVFVFANSDLMQDLTWAPVSHYKLDKDGKPSEEAKALRQRLIDRGKLFVKQFDRPCLDFDGETIDGREKVTGRIIADARTFWAYDRYTQIEYEIFGAEPTAFLSGDSFLKM